MWFLVHYQLLGQVSRVKDALAIGCSIDLTSYNGRVAGIILSLTMAPTERNSFVPISRLPPESLAAIFLKICENVMRFHVTVS